MRTVSYPEEEVKRFTEKLKEPMQHQIRDAMQLGIPKEYVELLMKSHLNYNCRAYLIGCMLDQEKSEVIEQLAKLKSVGEMVPERRKLWEKQFLKESALFEEYKKLSEVYRQQIERVREIEQRYQNALAEIASREKDNPEDDKKQHEKLEIEKMELIKKIRELYENIDLIRGEKESLQKENEEIKRRLRFLIKEENSQDLEKNWGLVVWQNKEHFSVKQKLIQLIRSRKRRKEEEKRKKFLEDYLKKETEPDKADQMVCMYQEGWELSDLEIIANCASADEMVQKKKSLERIRSYQAAIKKSKEKR